MPALYSLLALVLLPALACGQSDPWAPPQSSDDPCKVPMSCVPAVENPQDYGAAAAAAAEASPNSTPALRGCSAAQKKKIFRALNGDAKLALTGAKGRVLKVKTILDGTTLTPEIKLANKASKVMFGGGLETTAPTIVEMMDSMNKALGSPSLRCARPADSEYQYCSARPAFIVIGQTTIWLCPDFFKAEDESRARVLVHESSHLAGVAEDGGESYCMFFSCSEKCTDKGFRSADNWASFVNCVAGEPSDDIDVITVDR